MREFDTDTIRLITTFENMTGAPIRDCISGDSIYFLVEEGKAAMAIGKNGQTVKIAERLLGKPIKIVEWSSDKKQFIKNLIPKLQKIEIGENGIVKISVESRYKGSLIGKDGSNIKMIKKLLVRNTDIKDIKII